MTPQGRSNKEATKRSAPASSRRSHSPTKKPGDAPRRQQPAEPRDAADPLTLDAAEAARALGISTRTLWTLTNAGEVPHVRLGRRVVYARADLEAWLARRSAASVRGRRSAN